MIEQELGSIMRYIIANSKDCKAYIKSIPEGFAVPSVYFPPPELNTAHDTLNAYRKSYVWRIKFFGIDTNMAYEKAMNICNILLSRKNKIPLLDVAGIIIRNKAIVLTDIELKTLDKGAVSLTIAWDSRSRHIIDVEETITAVEVNLVEKT